MTGTLQGQLVWETQKQQAPSPTKGLDPPWFAYLSRTFEQVNPLGLRSVPPLSDQQQH